MKVLVTRSVAIAGLLGVLTLSLPCEAGSQAGSTERVSVSSTGVQSDNHSNRPVISDDGRFVAFESEAQNLDPLLQEDTRFDVFLRDRLLGTTVRVSKTPDNIGGNQESNWPSISGDGRYVIFYSNASNLAAGYTNVRHKLILYHVDTQQLSPLFFGMGGAQPDQSSQQASLSRNGDFACFGSGATNLVPNDTNETEDIFLLNRISGEIRRVSVSTGGLEGNWPSHSPSISRNGRFVVFCSRSTTFAPGTSGVYYNVFLHDSLFGSTVLVSKTHSGGSPNSNCFYPTVSDDGRFVTYESDAFNIVVGDTNWQPDIFLVDTVLGTTRRVSTSASGSQLSNGGWRPQISYDGTFVYFLSRNADPLYIRNDGHDRIFRKNLRSGEVNLVSFGQGGTLGSHGFGPFSVSGFDSFLTFSSNSTDLVPGDTNGREDVFVRQVLQVPLGVNPNSLEVVEGEAFDGDAQSVSELDGLTFASFPSPVTLTCTVDFFGQSSVLSPTLLRANTVAWVARPGLSQQTMAYDFDQGLFVLISGRTASLIPSQDFAAWTSTAPSFVGESGQLRIRQSWQPINDEDPALDGWLHYVDLVQWLVYPS